MFCLEKNAFIIIQVFCCVQIVFLTEIWLSIAQANVIKKALIEQTKLIKKNVSRLFKTVFTYMVKVGVGFTIWVLTQSTSKHVDKMSC